MDMTMSSATPSRVEVVTSVQRRRRWTPEQKLEIVKQTNEPGDAALVGDLMMQAVENRFGLDGKPPKPIEWLTDNGSCYTAAETRSFAKQLGLKPVTTPVTSPQSNGMAESFVKTLKRDYAKLADRPDSQTVMALLPKWFDDYNSYHPHSALGYVPAKLFRAKRAVN